MLCRRQLTDVYKSTYIERFLGSRDARMYRGDRDDRGGKNPEKAVGFVSLRFASPFVLDE